MDDWLRGLDESDADRQLCRPARSFAAADASPPRPGRRRVRPVDSGPSECDRRLQEERVFQRWRDRRRRRRAELEEWVRLALEAPDEERRDAVLGEALVERGADVVLDAWAAGDAFWRRTLERLSWWLDGGQLSDRADEPEVRLRAARALAAEYGDEVPV